ncbi:Protein of unknown function DUF2650 family-containing protein [Strongyloides ratti]|uniref:Uncharacterized protein n=1 Tax=Strongyloides ratti TaxID=34506 RepID=A0A090LJD3_STRRB|nr:Protein of unknown function DUF2650 family-containing protein [Strongyloides ratti]CEF68213.1 Protein of unknown function DUF2650 family-containing protein [Strongyloides ratti]
MSIGYYLTSAIFGTFVFLANGAKNLDDLKKTVDDAQTIEGGSKWCPIPLTGKECPPSSIFHYYKCCGTLMTDCCFNLQNWLIITLIVLAAITVIGIVMSIVSWLFCRK